MIGFAFCTDSATSVYVATALLVPAVYVQMQPAFTGVPALFKINWKGLGVIVPVAACIPADTLIRRSRSASTLRATRMSTTFWVLIAALVIGYFHEAIFFAIGCVIGLGLIAICQLRSVRRWWPALPRWLAS